VDVGVAAAASSTLAGRIVGDRVMTKDPWTDPDPQPGDFDEFIRTMDPSDIEVHEGNPNAKVTIVSEATGAEAKRLEHLALASDPPLYDVLADLRRAGKPHAA
jgi:hypothetical protein